MIISPHTVSPIVGNITTSMEIVASAYIDRRRLFSIELEAPWRKPVIYFPLQTDETLHCALDDRLHTNRNHSLSVQIIYEDSHVVLYVFLDGVLRNRCFASISENPFFATSSSPITALFGGANIKEITVYVEDKSTQQICDVVSVQMWPRILTYAELQHHSVGDSQRILSWQHRPPISWYTKANMELNSSPQVPNISPQCSAPSADVDSEECKTPEGVYSDTSVSSTTTVVLWPVFYSQRLHAKTPDWFANHIAEAVLTAVAGVDIVDGASVSIVIPLTVAHKEAALPLLRQVQSTIKGSKATVYVADITVPPLYGTGDAAVYSFATVVNAVVENALNGERNYLESMDEQVPITTPDYIAFISSHIYLEDGWLGSMLNELSSSQDTPVSVIGGKLVSPRGEILHFGYEMFELPYTGGTEILLTPHDRYRGYWPLDSRTRGGVKNATAVSRHLMSFSVDVWRTLGGFSESMSPMFEDSDLCLRAADIGLRVAITGMSVGISLEPLFSRSDSLSDYTSQIYSPLRLSGPATMAHNAFSGKWRESQEELRQASYLTPAKLTWVIHCGGSQGLEAATILQTLYKYIDVRTLIRRYKVCEHSDTLSGMPVFFRDVLEMSALKTFTKPYQGFLHPEEGCDGCAASDVQEDGSVVLYARDYREMGRWVPHDTSYMIGRYMYETNSLPRPWVNHCNNLDEVWVPSEWQRGAFLDAGVQAEKIQVMPETVDSYYFDPDAVTDLPLPGTILDGYARDDPERPYAFCSVFKMEGRKGYKELVEGFMREFLNSSNVVLVLRTYMHTGTGISEDNFNIALIRKEIDDHLKWRGLPVSDASDGKSGPRIEIVAEHLPSWQLVMFYKACDAFVLPTHAEGWGLPTHEAMIMGLPVITTNWGGSTEFVTQESGLLIDVPKLVPTFGDNWLSGYKWASVDVNHMQELMQMLYSNREFGKELGRRGQLYMEKFSPDVVARNYVERVAKIHAEVIPAQQDQLSPSSHCPFHGEVVASKLDISWSLSGKFKTCALRGYKKRNMLANSSAYHLNGNPQLCNVAIISTWAPRMCGIATFSQALRDALLEVCPQGSRVDVIAVKHKDEDVAVYNSTEVKSTFREHDSISYVEAAQFINDAKYHTVLVQYEYGMLHGDSLICMLREMKAPNVVTTVHTVHVNLEEHIHSWVQQVTFLSRKIVVMTHSMRHSLNVYHAIPTRDVAVIPHGGPDLEYERFDGTPLQTLYPGKKVILSNGLLHQMKGIEYVIRAMPRILEEVPDAVYLIHGRPHPNGVGTEEYYEAIKEEAGWTAPDNIFFNRSFAHTSDLYMMLKNARVYVNAYTDEGQSVSGTLAMALSVGTVAVSTPYSYAVEMLRNNTGRMVPFRDVNALADAIIDILKNDENHEVMSRNAYRAAQQQTW
eukprot:CAMPEP_0185031604 /NCGR_PEP_ID=MMETSP1103-20130426/19159_1 /TAXON_ID=36769 /ORGANISM="Paraphysomonas bandaiensis, Strain Caron Lab Isolate" /LENGTH=1396 /DNA_ID=CAMNT_0027567171 /DNA_START=153 /DNA_END=4340 /DNA_ORIENTATION=-